MVILNISALDNTVSKDSAAVPPINDRTTVEIMSAILFLECVIARNTSNAFRLKFVYSRLSS